MPTTVVLVLALVALGALLVYGLYAMDRIVRTHRATQPGST